MSFLVSFLTSFFCFFSGGGAGLGDLTDPWLSTAPMTATLAGSTNSSASFGGVGMTFLASRFSFFNL